MVWGDSIFVTAVVNEGVSEPPKTGLYLAGERPTPSSANHRWMVYCLDFRTGNLVWQKQVHLGAPPSSVHLKNTYKLLGRNSLNEMCLASPAIVRDSLILRTATALYRIRNLE